MGFGEAVKTCFRKYIVIAGRAPRSEYWWFYLFIIIGSIVALVIDSMFVSNASEGGPVQAVWGIATFVPSITAAVRRLHDTGRPGYYILAPLVFFFGGGVVMAIGEGTILFLLLGLGIILAGLLLMLYWLVQKSDPGDNRYGPNPFGGQRLDQVFE